MQDQDYRNGGRETAEKIKKAVQRVRQLRSSVTAVGILGNPYFWAAVILFFVFVIIVGIYVEGPKEIVKTLWQKVTGTIWKAIDHVVIFFGGSPVSDERLKDIEGFYYYYDEIAKRPFKDLDYNQRLQAEQFPLPTALIIGLDKMMHDPVFNEKKDFVPKPEDILKAVWPRFVWAPSYRIEDDESCSCGEDGCHIEREVKYPKTKLLIRADTFYGTYTWKLEWKEDVWYTPSQCGDLRHYHKYEDRISDKTPSEPYLPLREYMVAHGIYRDIDADFVIEVAKAYDVYNAISFRLFELNYKTPEIQPGKLIDPDEIARNNPDMAKVIDKLIETYPDLFEKAVWPTVTTNITSPFGIRIHPIQKVEKPHDGIDIADTGIEGKSVYAAFDGKVVYAGWFGGYGNYVRIDHGNGIETFYGHLQKIDVSVGQKIEAGDVLGTVGNTGGSTGPHLHFGVHVDGNSIDPYLLMSKALDITSRGASGGHGEDDK